MHVRVYLAMVSVRVRVCVHVRVNVHIHVIIFSLMLAIQSVAVRCSVPQSMTKYSFGQTNVLWGRPG